MKALTQHQKTEIGSTIAFLVILALAFMASCAITKPYPYYTEEEKWEQFRECSKFEGDAGCEECYIKIFGHPSI